MNWKNSVSKFVSGAEDKVVELNLDTKNIKYADRINEEFSTQNEIKRKTEEKRKEIDRIIERVLI